MTTEIARGELSLLAQMPDLHHLKDLNCREFKWICEGLESPPAQVIELSEDVLTGARGHHEDPTHESDSGDDSSLRADAALW